MDYALCHFKNLISPKPAWNSQWSLKKFKAIALLPILQPYFKYFLKKRFFRKSSKPGHGHLVLITSTVKHIPPYIKQDSIVHDHIHVTICSTYLFNNKNYSSVSWPCVSIDCGYYHLILLHDKNRDHYLLAASEWLCK